MVQTCCPATAASMVSDTCWLPLRIGIIATRLAAAVGHTTAGTVSSGEIRSVP